uniref:D-isomer specific 2-hydroxyacid dehydrogenase NAD-binding domain-containing protein n=1 Tax=Chrysotila carterae TaxID=13221 RepID=A0A7S4B726_CHRCT
MRVLSPFFFCHARRAWSRLHRQSLGPAHANLRNGVHRPAACKAKAPRVRREADAREGECTQDTEATDTEATHVFSRVYHSDELAQMLSRCDFVFSVFPDTALTRKLLDGDVLAVSAARARPAVLINAGRGSVISEASIMNALDRSWISHRVGDVFVEEPLRPSSPLWGDARVTVTPHVAAVTQPVDAAACFAGNMQRLSREKRCASSSTQSVHAVAISSGRVCRRSEVFGVLKHRKGCGYSKVAPLASVNPRVL